jgi:hypothetical protein
MRFLIDSPNSFLRRGRGAVAATLALALLGGVTAMPAAVRANDGEATAIALHPRIGGDAATLMVTGSWPTQCTPTFESAMLNGADLRIDARAVLSLCTRESTAYTIEVNPAAALEQPALPPAVYHVSYYAANGAQAEPKLRAFALVDTRSGAATSFAPETGFWWSTSGARQGARRNVFSVELQGSQLTVALMSYDRDGRGNWQFGTAALNGHTAHVPMLQLAGGSDPFASASANPRGEAGLMLDIEFRSNSLATAWLSRSGNGDDAALELQTMDLVRLPFADAGDGSAWKGDWILAVDTEQAVPQRLHLDHVSALDASNFRLNDDNAGIAVDCAIDPQNAELPPQRCVLRRRDGLALGEFDAIAITRMDGMRSDHVPLHLLRVSR